MRRALGVSAHPIVTTTAPSGVSRRATLARACFAGACLAAAAISRPARAHGIAGVVRPPARPPAARLTREDGRATTLQTLLAGRVTALQLIFTRCQATCPLQGALFARAARVLGDSVTDAQWLSVSIDPAHDTPPLLRSWLARHAAGARWRAARPEPSDLPPLFDFLTGGNGGTGGPDTHSVQVFMFDRTGRLAMRSVDFPPVDTVVRDMNALAGR
jgi:protein SCO1